MVENYLFYIFMPSPGLPFKVINSCANMRQSVGLHQTLVCRSQCCILYSSYHLIRNNALAWQQVTLSNGFYDGCDSCKR